MLYDEHTWGAYCSISEPDSEFTKAQWKIKAQFAVDADKRARRRSSDQGAGGAGLAGARPRARPWSSSIPQLAADRRRSVMLPRGHGRWLMPDVPCVHGARGVLLLVKDVPACGYRVLKLVAEAKAAPSRAAGRRAT